MWFIHSSHGWTTITDYNQINPLIDGWDQIQIVMNNFHNTSMDGVHSHEWNSCTLHPQDNYECAQKGSLK